MLSNNRLANNIVLVIIILFVFLILAPLTWGIYRDSGQFLYVAQRLLAGDVPYRDMWDHKPPMIYFIDAIGLILGKGSISGVWLMGFVGVSTAAWCGYRLLYRCFGFLPAVFGSLAWLLMLVGVIEGGNLTEEYALPCQFASLLLYSGLKENERLSWRGFLIGALLGFSFLLKQNIIGVWAAIAILHVIRYSWAKRWGDLGKDILVTLAGFLGVTGLILLYFYFNHAVNNFYDAAFTYNYFYTSNSTLDVKISAFKMGLSYFGGSFLVIGGWVYALITLKAIAKDKGLFYLIAVSIIGLPLEFYLTSVSGIGYKHYYMAWLPFMAVFFGFVFYIILGWGKTFLRILGQDQDKWKNSIFLSLMVPGIIFLLIVAGLNRDSIIFLESQYPFSFDSTYKDLCTQLKSHTVPKDYILVWGAWGVINFLTERPSPTKYFYQYPLVTKGYLSDQRTEEFINDIKTKAPKIIIDSHDSNLPPLDSEIRKTWFPCMDARCVFEYPTSNLAGFFNFLSAHYSFMGNIDGWGIYILKG